MTEIWLYGIIGDSWDGLDAKSIVAQIGVSDDDIMLRINSPGGYVMEGLAVFNVLASAKAAGRKITVQIDALAASMASVIAMIGDEIIMADTALMMIHNPWDCACGDANELRRAADQLDLIRDQLLKIYAGRTGMDVAALTEMLNAETWMTAQQALDQKFVTAIAAPVLAQDRITTLTNGRACDLSQFGYRKIPTEHRATAMAAWSPAAAAAFFNGVTPMSKATPAAPAIQPAITSAEQSEHQAALSPVNESGGAAPPAAAQKSDPADAAVAAQQAVATERTRIAEITALCARHRIDAPTAARMIADGASVEAARAQILDHLASAGDQAQVGGNGRIVVTADARDKALSGAAAWIFTKAGVANMIATAAKARGETVDLNPGEYRGVSMVDLARETLAAAGVRNIPRDRQEIVKQALLMGARNAISNGTSDFTVLLENVLHKTLQAAYAVTPDTWSRFCGIGTINDFRPHSRYLRGSIAALEVVNENGEFKQLNMPDGAKETITGTTKGGIIGITRQALVNDDLDALNGIVTDAGRAAKLTIEKDVYALLTANPVMNDGIALFHASHNNLAGAGAVPSVTSFDEARVGMGSQMDVSGNEVLDIMPAVGLFPLSKKGLADVINGSIYDPDAANKLQRANMVAGMFADVIGSARATGNAWYAFADPSLAPAIEVAFLDGNQEPYTESRDGWTIDGIETKVRHDYAVGAVNWRSAWKNPGA